ncbi:MAG: hypothetical protein IJT33_03535 [Campylobacter sp.]|nr:hypothetical protein [Campylobacter sp.]
MSLDEIFEKFFYQILIILVGIGASFVRVMQKKHENFKSFFVAFIGGVFSSVFFCWLGYEVAFYFTQAQQYSLAIGGFCAWQGGEWIKQVVDDFIKNRITNKKDNQNGEI